MITVMLLMIVAGICLTQLVSNAHDVTLLWLRLGGIISVSLLVVAALSLRVTQGVFPFDVIWAVAAVTLVAQLMAVQLNKRRLQRLVAVIAFVATCTLVMMLIRPLLTHSAADAAIEMASPTSMLAVAMSIPLSSGLMGGMLMAMLLGHAYLTAGNEMTQRPFRRLVLLMALLLAARAACSVAFGLWPWWFSEDMLQSMRAWTTVMITGRYLAGFVVPGVFIYMTYDCVQRRANQSATGILYVASVVIFVGEGIALALMGSTGLMF